LYLLLPVSWMKVKLSQAGAAFDRHQGHQRRADQAIEPGGSAFSCAALAGGAGV
jgi:hypothetical protein